MKDPLHKANIAFLSGVALLVLVPLELVVCWVSPQTSLQANWEKVGLGARSLLPQQQEAQAPGPTVPAPPSFAEAPAPFVAVAPQTQLQSSPLSHPTLVSDRSYLTPPPQLSPDGLYAAEFGTDRATSTWGSLVVYRTANHREIARQKINAQAVSNLQWGAAGNSLMNWDRSAQVWMWKGSDGPPEGLGDVTLYDGSGSNQSYISPAGDVVVQNLPDGSFNAYTTATGEITSLGYNWRPIGGMKSLAIVPTKLGAIAPTVQAVLTDQWAQPNPTPIPTPPPTPKPLTPEQKSFQARDDVLAEELSNIVMRLQSEEEISKAEEKRLIARANVINKLDREGRARFFPPAKQDSAAKRPLGPEDYSRVELRDLTTGKLIWTRKTSSTVWPPHPRFSPDGSALVLLGSPRMTGTNGQENGGAEVLDPLTGLTRFRIKMGAAAMNGLETVRFFQSTHAMMAFTEAENRESTLHVIDLSSGHEVSKWQLSDLKALGISSLREFSCDANGNNWIFSVDTGENWKVFTREQLEAQSKILVQQRV